MATHDKDEKDAQRYLAGEAKSPKEAFGLVKELQNKNKMRLAAEVAERALKAPEDYRIRLLQKRMICTYKDPESAFNVRFQKAEEYATELRDRLPGMSDDDRVETCGIIGAMYKYRWFRNKDWTNLEQSLSWYRGEPAGSDLADTKGYTRINAAFVLDLMAQELDNDTGRNAKRAEAAELRKNILKDLESVELEDWWLIATVFEAYFGVKQYKEAAHALEAWEKTHSLPDKWSWASTVAQIMGLAALHNRWEGLDEAAEQALECLTGGRQHHLRKLAGRKIGLALSGGGFRASLFQIGVLARLAELDLLRHVEVLSCVSGGSILGARYYLALREKLQKYADADIRHEHYVALVEELATGFLAGIQKNLRDRMLLGSWKLWTSSTERLGDLYDAHLFGQVDDENGQARSKFFGFRRKRRQMSDLKISPPGAPDLNPVYDNWQRAAKVPILLLNSSTLNTGHNWQFTASFMGEPPRSKSEEFGSTGVIERIWYGDPQVGLPHIDLAQAVAASACVPGLLAPLELRRAMSTDEKSKLFVTRLIDGGVCDNQGVGGLIDQNCDILLVIDASGQMPTVDDPPNSRLGVYQRTTDMLMARIRELQYTGLVWQTNAQSVKEMLWVHMKEGLREAKIENNPLTPREGLNASLVGRLAEIRTDLDAFNTVEAYALMYCGYRMAEVACEDRLADLKPDTVLAGNWPFMALKPVLQSLGGERVEQLEKLLHVGACQTFKIWRLWTRPFSSKILSGLHYMLKKIPRWASTSGGLVVVIVTLLAHWPDQIQLPSRAMRLSVLRWTGPLAIGMWCLLAGVLWLCDRLYIRWGSSLLAGRAEAGFPGDEPPSTSQGL